MLENMFYLTKCGYLGLHMFIHFKFHVNLFYNSKINVSVFLQTKIYAKNVF